jgi:uncharacterized protein (TIGR00369 family)
MTSAAGFDCIPINALLGMRLQARGADQAEVRMKPGAGLVQEAGVIHGGILTTLADTAAVYLLWPDLQEGESMTSIDFSMHFLAPAIPGGEVLRAEARPIRFGRTVCVAESQVFQGGRLLARGTFTYLRRQRDSGRPAPPPPVMPD